MFAELSGRGCPGLIHIWCSSEHLQQQDSVCITVPMSTVMKEHDTDWILRADISDHFEPLNLVIVGYCEEEVWLIQCRLTVWMNG